MPDTLLNTQPGCDDDFDPLSLTCDEALARMAGHLEPMAEVEQVPLRAALGRVLGAPIVSRINVPGHVNSAMDGFAINASDIPAEGIRTLKVVGSAFAGHPWPATLAAGTAVRIMTGAVVPEGADTILPQEQVEAAGELLRIDGRHRRGQHLRAAGEDIAIGAEVLRRGHFLNPAELGLIASLGIPEVTVIRRPRIAFFSTGDELRALGEPLGPGEIHDSNRYTLHGMLTRIGAEVIDLGVVPDEREALAGAFAHASRVADVVITSGGVSVGEADYTREILARLGEVHFWKVAMKPGRPLAFGRLGQALFFGLPGNPVSVMVTFYEFVQPALRKLMGLPEALRLTLQARTTGELKKRPGRIEFQRGVLSRATDGELEVAATGDQGSGILSSMTNANCFIILGMDTARVPAGSLVEIELFNGLVQGFC